MKRSLRACGSQMVIGYRGGRLPDTSCTVSRDFDYCATDGGDAATNDADAATDVTISDGGDASLGDAADAAEGG